MARQGYPDDLWKLITKVPKETSASLVAKVEFQKPEIPNDTMQAMDDRKSARLRLLHLAKFFELESARARYWQATKIVRWFRRRNWQRRQELLTEELALAWRHRRFADVWRTARALAGRAIGPPKRRCNVHPSARLPKD